MRKTLCLALIVFTGLFTAGCALIVVGAVTGTGVYTYINGELQRSYQTAYDRTLSVTADTLQTLEIPITEKISDGLSTSFKAKRADGTPVAVKVEMVESNITRVSVRTGLVGYWDKEGSELIHENLAKRL